MGHNSVKEFWVFQYLMVQWKQNPESVTLDDFKEIAKEASWSAEHNKTISDFFRKPVEEMYNKDFRKVLVYSLSDTAFKELVEAYNEDPTPGVHQLILDYRALKEGGDSVRIAEIEADTSLVNRTREELDNKRLEISYGVECCKLVVECVADREDIEEIVNYYQTSESCKKLPIITKAVKNETIDCPEAQVPEKIIESWLRTVLF